MRKNMLAVAAIWSAVLCGSACAFEISVPAVSDEKWDPKFLATDCHGQNISPAVVWANAPAGTKSFVITLYDRDAMGGYGWWHWQVFKIPAAATGLPEGAGAKGNSGLPKGAVLGNGDLGKPGYLGPCPPTGSGVHRYVFTVYALKSAKPETEANASPGMILADTMRDTLGSASITYTLTR